MSDVGKEGVKAKRSTGKFLETARLTAYEIYFLLLAYIINSFFTLLTVSQVGMLGSRGNRCHMIRRSSGYIIVFYLPTVD